MKDDTYPVVPGKAGRQRAVHAHHVGRCRHAMPHKDSNKKLTADQIALIKRWIEEGAEWKGHWSYVPPVKPAVPSATQPTGRLRLSARRAEGKIRPQSDRQFHRRQARRTGDASVEGSGPRDALRRLSLDLIGLPPTQAKSTAFVNDQSPDAYEKQVDRLLASPHFGERMSVMWMDLVRYGDTIGFHSDNPREVWPWRDWCINAFNRNEPFNQFTIEQVAGDLVAECDARAEGRIRLQPAAADDRRRRRAGEGVRAEIPRRSRPQRRHHVARRDDGLLPVPRPQVRSVLAERFLPDGRVLRGHPGAGHLGAVARAAAPDAEQEKELNRLTDAIVGAKRNSIPDTPELAAAQVKWEQEYRDKWAAMDVKDAAVKWTPLTITEAKSAGGAMLKITQGKEGDTDPRQRPESVDRFVRHQGPAQD
jgi:hypothetical protein